MWPQSRYLVSPSLYYFPFVNWRFWLAGLLWRVDNMVLVKTSITGPGIWWVHNKNFLSFLILSLLFSGSTQGTIIAMVLNGTVHVIVLSKHVSSWGHIQQSITLVGNECFSMTPKPNFGKFFQVSLLSGKFQLIPLFAAAKCYLPQDPTPFNLLFSMLINDLVNFLFSSAHQPASSSHAPALK